MTPLQKLCCIQSNHILECHNGFFFPLMRNKHFIIMDQESTKKDEKSFPQALQLHSCGQSGKNRSTLEWYSFLNRYK